MAINKVIKVSEIIGAGYDDFWRFKGRYLVCKGGRASKKSSTASLKIIYLMMKYSKMNCLVLRQTYNTHRNSTFEQLKWAIEKFGVEDLWETSVSPLSIRYKPTGQQILFRGLDDANKITSIAVARGVLNLLWVEEAYEINEEQFNKVDMSLRGQLPPDYFIQEIFTFNP